MTQNKNIERAPKQIIDGWLVVDKPLGVTSCEVGRILKRTFHPQKIGHIGTLDPLASGVLVFVFGEATKLIPYLPKLKKRYVFHVTFGEQRTTDDAEGEIVTTSNVIPTISEIENVLAQFVGKISQVPPKFSAIQQDGKRSYDRARKGEDFELPARSVDVHSLSCLKQVDEKTYAFEVSCGSGTYVRSLARDIAIATGTVGYVSFLRRTCDGLFDESHAIALEKIDKIEDNKNCFFPLSFVLDDIPAITVGKEVGDKLNYGQPVLIHSISE